MKKLKIVMQIILMTGLYAFSAPPGGEYYSISVNQMPVIEYLVYQKKQVPNLTLSRESAKTVEVMYNHCGQPGKGRKLAIADSENNVLKEWKFEDVNTLSQATMTIETREIIALQKGKATTLQLFYSSKDLPSGRVLATVFIEPDKVISGR